MATDAKKHTSPAAGEIPSRASLAASILSIRDIVPVANATEANQIAAAVAAGGQTLATDPITVARLDAPGMHMVEMSTVTPGVWRPASGVLHFANDAARDTWTSANSALLTGGDRCVSNGVEQRWRYGGWVPVDPVISLTNTGAQSGITTATTITGLSVAITLPGPSMLRVRAGLHHAASSNDTVIAVDLKDGAATVATWSRMSNSSPTVSGAIVGASFETILSAVAAGAHTYTLQISRALGTGVIQTSPTANQAHFLSIEVI